MTITYRIMEHNSAYSLKYYLQGKEIVLLKTGLPAYSLFVPLVGMDFFDVECEELHEQPPYFPVKPKYHHVNLHNIFNPSLYDTMFEQVEHDRRRSQ